MPTHPTPGRLCAGPGCRTRIDRRWLMCDRCWALIPDSLRRQINRTHRARAARQSIRYHAAVRQAIDTIAATRRTTEREAS